MDRAGASTGLAVYQVPAAGASARFVLRTPTDEIARQLAPLETQRQGLVASIASTQELLGASDYCARVAPRACRDARTADTADLRELQQQLLTVDQAIAAVPGTVIRAMPGAPIRHDVGTNAN
jgi:hypothetical protein